MKTQAKVALGIAVLLVAGLLGYFLAARDSDNKADKALDNAAPPSQVSTPSPSATGTPSATDTPTTVALPGAEGVVLNQGDTGVVVTEYMDFECPACKAHTTLMSELLEKYDGKVTIAVRPLPLEMHPSAKSAWLSALAAYQQGKFGEMYQKLFSTQESWSGEKDQAALFRDYAEELGLNMDAYDASVADPASEAVLTASTNDAMALGAPGTPSWVVDGKIVEMSNTNDLINAIDSAVSGS